MQRPGRIMAIVLVAAAIAAPAIADPPAASTTPAAFYLAYRAAFDKATKIEDLFPYHSAAIVKEMEADPPSTRATKFEFMKMLNPLTNITVVKESRTPAGATLTVTGMGDDQKTRTGTVVLVREHGDWKISAEDWPD